MRHALLPARTRSGETVEILPADADLAKLQMPSQRTRFCRAASLTSHLEWIIVPGAIAARREFEHARNRPRQNPSSRRLVEERSLMQGASTERCGIAYPTVDSPFREGVQALLPIDSKRRLDIRQLPIRPLPIRPEGSNELNLPKNRSFAKKRGCFRLNCQNIRA